MAILVMVEADSYKERNKYSDIFRLVCTYLNINHHILSRISNFEIGIFKKFSINQIVFNNNQASRNHSNLLKFSGKSVVENSWKKLSMWCRAQLLFKFSSRHTFTNSHFRILNFHDISNQSDDCFQYQTKIDVVKNIHENTWLEICE